VANHLAIATITATLQRMLQAAVQNDVKGARVTTVRPSDIGGATPETGANLFMYHVVSNPALNNVDATLPRSRGNPIRRQAALDLHYMMSFYGNESELAPQRMLGSVVRTLNDRSILTPDMIRATCLDTRFPFLRHSTLAEQVQQISLLPLDFNLDDLSKAWSVFFQVPYILSVAYKVLVVTVDGEETSTRSLPVRSRPNGVMPMWTSPQIDRIVAHAGLYQPITADSVLEIRGKRLKGLNHTQVRIFGQTVTPTQVKEEEVILPLTMVPMEHRRAGMQSLQILHPIEIGKRGAESNAMPFVLRPQVLRSTVTETEEVDDDLFNATLRVETDLPIGPDQRVIVSLNQWSVETPEIYMFEAKRRSVVSNTIEIPLEQMKPGEYLVRLLIDGAESQLVVDDNPQSPTYEWFIGPRIQINPEP
jgi:Pvc16 N-terminal domain